MLLLVKIGPAVSEFTQNIQTHKLYLYVILVQINFGTIPYFLYPTDARLI